MRRKGLFMKIYHIDRRRALCDGMTLTLNQFGNSEHGHNYWGRVKIEKADRFKDFLVEHIFEEVRLRSFPDKPSRFKSLFACAPDDVGLWIQKLSASPDTPIWEIETQSAQLFDAGFLDCFRITGGEVNFGDIERCAIMYWSGAMIAEIKSFPKEFQPRFFSGFNPLPEYLVPLPTRVGSFVRTSERQPN